MGFNNPKQPWSEIERRLSDRVPARPAPDRVPARPTADPQPSAASRHAPEHAGDGSDAPAWSRHRLPYEAQVARAGAAGTVPYAELHAHSNFSFLDGASHPEELVEEAARLGLEALALCDHHGFYGVVRFAEAARAVGLPTVFGAELTVDLPALRSAPRTGSPDPQGRHLVVLARSPAGYARLARAISVAQMAGEKSAPRIGLEQLASTLRGTSGGSGNGSGEHLVLTGCRKGTVPAALMADGPGAAERELRRLVEWFGADHVAVELWDHHDPLDGHRNDALAELAAKVGVAAVATNNVHYATPDRRHLATALAAVRARCSLDDLDGWIPGGGTAHLRSGAEQARRFARYPGVVEAAARLGRECAFDLRLVAPSLPPYPCPEEGGVALGEMAFLRRLVAQGAARRYGEVGSQRQAVFEAQHARDPYAQLAHELDLIERLGFAGYFLIVWDIVEFCRRSNILCQGRGSAANSAVCYALGITKADAVSLWACCSNGSCRPSATARPTSTSTSSRTAARRSSSTSTGATGARMPPRSRTSSPTERSRRYATWLGRSGMRRVNRTRGRRRPTAGGAFPLPVRRATTPCRCPMWCWPWRTRCCTSLVISASIRGAW